jgi:hypothetical protein
MADDAIILGSETPDADVLVYDKDVAYYEGVIVNDQDDIVVDDVGDTTIYEYVK